MISSRGPAIQVPPAILDDIRSHHINKNYLIRIGDLQRENGHLGERPCPKTANADLSHFPAGNFLTSSVIIVSSVSVNSLRATINAGQPNQLKHGSWVLQLNTPNRNKKLQRLPRLKNPIENVAGQNVIDPKTYHTVIN